MVNQLPKLRRFSLSDLLDHFIPVEIQVQPEAHRRARMFMISHVFGPILGNSLPLYLAVSGLSRDYRVWVFFLSILAFWIYPFVLRATGRYQLLAFLSVQNLIFCVLWACFAFGGLLSPFVPWMLMFPLLAFLYLPPDGWVRNVLLFQIFGSVALFVLVVTGSDMLPHVDVTEFQVIGMISMAAVATYFAMMALYFAKMLQEQREFSRELNGLVSTSDNVRNLTAAANQASAAKADFVASMSHELRTPLNAIIGYSQLLLEEAADEEDKDTIADLSHVHKAGTDLLRLIDDILDYSRIEAGKMPVNPAFGTPRDHVGRWQEGFAPLLAANGSAVAIEESAGLDHAISTDWTALGHALRHMLAGVIGQSGGLDFRLRFDADADGALCASLTDCANRDSGAMKPEWTGNGSFDHHSDASPTKYGGTGIEMALAQKFGQLIGGSIGALADADGSWASVLTVPDYSVTSVQQAA